MGWPDLVLHLYARVHLLLHRVSNRGPQVAFLEAFTPALPTKVKLYLLFYLILGKALPKLRLCRCLFLRGTLSKSLTTLWRCKVTR